jgi:hypothetical protein
MDDARVAKWLRSVELTPGSDRQAAIVKAADEFAAGAGGPDVAAMVQLAFKLNAEDAFSALSDRIRESDTTFAGRADELETQLAAGVLIAEVLDEDSPVSACAGHCVLSAEWSQLTSALADLPRLARDALVRRAEAQRKRSDRKGQSLGDVSVPELPEDTSPVTHVEGRALGAAVSTLAAQANARAQQLDALTDSLRARDEEVNLLWWAFSGYSEQDAKPWPDIEADGRAAILAGFEFKWSVEFDTEPRRSTQILRRVLGNRGSNELSLVEAVQQASVGELRLPETIPNQVLLPVMVSLRECKDFAGKPGWIDSVGRWGIDPAHAITCLDLAGQTLRELLLIEHLT